MAEKTEDWVHQAVCAAGGKAIVGVMGGGSAAEADLRAAETFGGLVARSGYALLTGGGPGIMEAASRGARRAGGPAIGVLPVQEPAAGYPNAFVTHPLFTGLGAFNPATGDAGRNRINILASDLIAAFPGAAGTNSEIRLAAENRKPLVLVGWTLPSLEGASRVCLRDLDVAEATTPEQALEWVQGRLN